MSAIAYSKTTKTASFEESPSKTEIGLGDKPLYFKNHGLFSENYLLNHLGKSKESFLMRAWETEDLPAFSALYEWMLSTWHERKDEFELMKEAQLEEEWIRPILQRLGWEYVVQPDLTRHGKRQIPDYALFDDVTSKKKAMKAGDENLFDGCSLVADAKAMHVDLDGKSMDNSNPSFQIMQYLTYTNKDWGILTNGRYWRLYSLKSKTKFRSYFEVNIEKFLNGNSREDGRFKYFYNFFNRTAFAEKNAAGQSFIDIVFSDGEQYAQQVETELKERAFELVEMIANGFQSSLNAKSEQELKGLYSHSLYYLFRMIFILNCEAKGLLHISRQGDYFKYSLRNTCNSIKDDFVSAKKWSNQSRTYNQIKDLFKLLASGDSSIGIHGFGKEVFETGQKNFFDKNEIPDSILNEVLLRLSCQFDKKNKSWSFIDYTRLSIDHMGSIFEGLLEYKLISQKERLSLVNSSGERKFTGSYYTPEYIVDHIVKKTLAPLVDGKTAKEILELKIIDPAMGSGHFLLGAVKFLEEEMMARLNDGDTTAKSLSGDVRWEVLHSCVYGIDINPLAVELSKFSLWMYSATSNRELETLSDQLKCSDSLMPWNIGVEVDAVVGNPPYVNAVILSSDEAYKNKIKARYASASGAFDIASLFFESSKLNSKKCRIGFILPNKLLSSKGAKGMREFLFSSPICQLETIEDLSSVPVFKDASVYPVIMITTSEKPKTVQVRIHGKTFDANLKFEKRKVFGDADSFLPKLISTQSVQLGKGIPLSEVCEMLGAATVAEAYEFKKAVSEKSGKASQKFIVSGNVLNFGTSWGVESTQYIKQGYMGPYFDLNNKVVSPKRKSQYESEKIVVANMTTVLKAFHDAGSFVPGKSTTIIMNSKVPLKALAAYLNSSIATQSYKEKFNSLKMNGGALRIGPPQLKELEIPFALQEDKKIQKQLIEIYDGISDECAKLLKGNNFELKQIRKALEGAEGVIESIDKLRSKLNDICSSAWGISAKKAA
ncbi:MAG: hypothetical protein A4S09_13685 [Proteobacteria bacterium SG_bin7]|nr:MAG: hypothetical protein A4S09_13685 [Proteobacteria bacterium SG_bin7]